MVQEKVGRLDLAHGLEQETIPAVFSNRVEWSRSYPRIRGMDAKPYGRCAAEMTTRVTTTWAEQLKREGTIGRFVYDHAQNLAARGTPGGERPET